MCRFKESAGALKLVSRARRFTALTIQNTPEFLAVSLATALFKELSGVHRRDLLRHRRDYELIDAGAVLFAQFRLG